MSSQQRFRHWGAETNQPYCSLSKFLTWRNHERNKMVVALYHYVLGWFFVQQRVAETVGLSWSHPPGAELEKLENCKPSWYKATRIIESVGFQNCKGSCPIRVCRLVSPQPALTISLNFLFNIFKQRCLTLCLPTSNGEELRTSWSILSCRSTEGTHEERCFYCWIEVVGERTNTAVWEKMTSRKGSIYLSCSPWKNGKCCDTRCLEYSAGFVTCCCLLGFLFYFF